MKESLPLGAGGGVRWVHPPWHTNSRHGYIHKICMSKQKNRYLWGGVRWVHPPYLCHRVVSDKFYTFFYHYDNTVTSWTVTEDYQYIHLHTCDKTLLLDTETSNLFRFLAMPIISKFLKITISTQILLTYNLSKWTRISCQCTCYSYCNINEYVVCCSYCNELKSYYLGFLLTNTGLTLSLFDSFFIWVCSLLLSSGSVE